MVVKSATKKRLMELSRRMPQIGNRQGMTDIKTLSHDEIASILGTSKDLETFTNVMSVIAEQGSRRRAQRRARK